MNRYVLILIVLVIIIGAGVAYKQFGGKAENVVTGETKEFTIYNRQNRWTFDPDAIEVNEGDKVKLTLINEDDYDHGIAIDQFGVSQRIPAKSTIKLEFIASTPGEWPYYCSVSCSSGIVDGKPRGHFDQIGKLKVNSKHMMSEADMKLMQTP